MKRLVVWINNLRFRKKLRLAFFITTAIPIFLLGIITYKLSVNSLNLQMNSSMRDSAKNMQYIISQKLNQYIDATSEILADDDFIRYAKSAYDSVAYFDSVESKRINDILGILGINSNSLEIYKPPSGNSEEELSIYNDLASNFRNNSGGIVFLTEDDGFSINRQIVDFYTGESVGYLKVYVETKNFFKEYMTMNYDQYGISVIDSSGMVIYKNIHISESGVIPVEYIADNPSPVSYHGRKYISASGSVDQADWKVTCFILFTSDEIDQILWMVILVSVIAAVLMSALGFVISHQVTSRIDTLTAAMLKVQNGGSLLMNLPKEPHDEIGMLTEIFENMLNSINHYIEQEYKANLRIKESELKALQAQINPHFLYNCLNVINWRAVMNSDYETSHVVMSLSDFYRTALNRGKSEISVRDELKNARAYIDIQLELHNNSFDVAYDIDQSVLDYEIINLTLQPIIENAIEHGIDSVEISVYKNVKGCIKLKVYREKDNIVISVFNTGPSISEKKVEEIFGNQSGGYGIYNVQTRLQNRFGSMYGIKIKGVENGTVCTVTIPAIEFTEEKNEG